MGHGNATPATSVDTQGEAVRIFSALKHDAKWLQHSDFANNV